MKTAFGSNARAGSTPSHGTGFTLGKTLMTRMPPRLRPVMTGHVDRMGVHGGLVEPLADVAAPDVARRRAALIEAWQDVLGAGR